ncbi:baseplate multidomain protein megatron [Pseudaminobacter soli (ex Li et al. 2025)]|uniref:Host specificity protein n=1 Tax=Pseudaminobacter soli (ex Li et al. 2025) TaxID=1295366 RepID=A0A2P7SFR7_9HYPH|nr:glycoside hydrolase/phage tail family protein [Mesorhizobium soli]PSJ61334.1 host specificity protein [Mesorhizobium soli]
MATIVLQAAGAALGSVLGPVGSVIGSALGAMAGYAIDQAVLNSTPHIEGPRLANARPFTAEEGASIPRVYGTTRLGGTLIWATRFEEKSTTRREGKNGPRITEYSYFANVAFALCEGKIAGIRRIWADGREIDRNDIEIRIYRGTEDQPVDPLISAKQGKANAPAYRGVAYVVLEHFALADYGNRIPQFQFEILRPVGEVTKQVRAVCLVPGATEYGLSPKLVKQQKRQGETAAANRNMLYAATDIAASLDELQMLCPNLEHVAIVAAWFGDDLRAGNCRIRPAVTTRASSGFSSAWSVSGVSRENAVVVSVPGKGAAYGGTPSDSSIIAAIREIKARGLKVTLYPFVMMDVPANNALPDPYGGQKQSAYPWRGRITCNPAPMQPGTADGTASARTQVLALCGNALRTQFIRTSSSVVFTGASGDWGYRRFILHFAHLAAAAGGVDAFLIGTELRGLTTLRDQNDSFPFVEALCTLADDVRATVGTNTLVTYGADWSEYFGHHPANGNVYFHLDALWAHPAIGAIGIDNYMPLSDWRDADYSAPNSDGFRGPYDPVGLRAAINSGEGYDWYYPSDEARLRRERSPITDGAYGKPWVYRYKDIASWWSNRHYDRVGGAEVSTPTSWVPCSKPIWFTELGCPAVDKGPNQPNVFPDPKSVENGIPYFSNGGRSDLAQQRLIEAHARHWNPSSADFTEADNPVSPLYGGRMVDPSRIYLWAWDARPFPAFPLQKDIWSDGDNWSRGHWLNGRIDNPSAEALINRILRDHGLPPADATNADGTVQGYVIADPSSAREALEPLVELFDLAVQKEADGLVFRSNAAQASATVELRELVDDGKAAVVETVRTPDHQLPVEGILAFRDPLKEYQTVSVRSVRLGASGSRQHVISFPGVLEASEGQALLDGWMRRTWAEREKISFSVPSPSSDIVPGAIVRLANGDGTNFMVNEIEDGLVRKVTATQVARAAPAGWKPEIPDAYPQPPINTGQPFVELLDLPCGAGGDVAQEQFRIAAWQKPWRSQLVFVSPEETGYAQRGVITRPASVGCLVEPLEPGFEGRVDSFGSILVELFDAEASSVSRLQLSNGANAAAVKSANGGWEILQFQQAEEVAPDIWRLGKLLRGQLGTNDAMSAGALAGASFVMLDEAVQPAGLLGTEIGLDLNWRIGPSGADFSDERFATVPAAGGMRALLPLSPVHLKASRTASGDLAVTWVRRGRVGADDWGPSEIPLGEEREEYQVTIARSGATVRTAVVQSPRWVYPAAQLASDLPGASAFDLTIRQFSVAAGWGLPATRRISLS